MPVEVVHAKGEVSYLHCTTCRWGPVTIDPDDDPAEVARSFAEQHRCPPPSPASWTGGAPCRT